MPTYRAVTGLALVSLGMAKLADGRAADLWVDRPLRIIQTSTANFPAALTLQGITEGEVHAVLHVDANGKFADCLITAYTHRELATEVLGNVRDWSYEPALDRGSPVGTRVKVTFTFQARGTVLSLTPNDALTLSVMRLGGTTLISLVSMPADLDEPLRAVRVVQPRHPGKFPRGETKPIAVVDFYIDADGCPRMPVVTRASHEALAVAAAEALAQWRFAPPKRDGRPVVVRAVQSFVLAESS